MAGPMPLLVPVQIDAFRLNEAACGDGSGKDLSTRIAPITQPNYTFLRLNNFVLQNDVLSHVDLHNSAPTARNPRLRDLSKMPTSQLRHRRGIYLHWTLPRCYRSGVSMSGSAPEARRKEERDKKDLQTGSDGELGGDSGQKVGSSTPGFIQPPTRWLIVRKLDVNSIEPPEAKSAFKDKEYVAWVIESDFLWKLNDIPLDYDLQVHVSPFVTNSGIGVNTKQLMQQAEVFIGRRVPLEQWTDSTSTDPLDTSTNSTVSEPPDISLIRSSNQLFADYQFTMPTSSVCWKIFATEMTKHLSTLATRKQAITYLAGTARTRSIICGRQMAPSISKSECLACLWASLAKPRREMKMIGSRQANLPVCSAMVLRMMSYGTTRKSLALFRLMILPAV